MSAPLSESYSVASGAAFRAGRHGYSNVNAVLVGDSITQMGRCGYDWHNALSGGKLRLIENLGIWSETIDHVISRIDHDYRTVSTGLGTGPGLAGLEGTEWVILRIGTNNFRSGGLFNDTHKASYATLIGKILPYCKNLIVMAVPPCTGGLGIPAANTWLSSYCAGVPRVHFVDDTLTVGDGTGNWRAPFEPPDGVHPSYPGVQQMGMDGAPQFAALLSGYPSPLASFTVDGQRVLNPFMTGVGGVNSIGTGQVPTSWSVAPYGAGFTVNSQIVFADAGDPNQSAWLRLTPVQVTAGSNANFHVTANCLVDGVTASAPELLEMMMQLRFNAFDASKFGEVTIKCYGNANEDVVHGIPISMGYGILNGIAVARSAMRRTAPKDSTALSVILTLTPTITTTGDMGSIDVRLASLIG